jgi:hypothetical protein
MSNYLGGLVWHSRISIALKVWFVHSQENYTFLDSFISALKEIFSTQGNLGLW